MKFKVANLARSFGPVQNPLRLQVGHRGIVLVQSGDQDAHALGARRLGQDSPPALVSIVTDFAPIDGDNHDRLTGAQKHKPVGEERIVDLLDRGNAAAHARMADGRRHIGGENGQGIGGFFLALGREGIDRRDQSQITT